MVIKKRAKKVYKPLSPPQNKANKILVIAVIAVVALVGLSLLLFFSDTFVGKGIEPNQQNLFSCANSPGLLHLWKGENSGEDSVGGADLTLTGATYGEGKVGQSFYFDGTKYTNVNAAIDLAAEGLADKISIEMWVRIPSFEYLEVGPSGEYKKQQITFFELGGGRISIGITKEGKMYLNDYASSYGTTFSVKSNDPLPLNEWTHVLAIYNGNSLKLYINEKETLGIIPIKKQEFTSNKIEINKLWKFKLGIDELAIYNEDLSNCMQQYICGNGKTDLGEQCDDGNKLEDDLCTSSCTFTPKVQEIKVLVVKTCSTDGTICSDDLQKNGIQTTLNGANDIYARSGSRIRFVINPATSFDFVKDDLIASRNILSKPVSEIEQLTAKDLNGDGKFDDNDAKSLILYDGEATGKARTDFSLKYPNSLVVFALAVQHTEPEYDDSIGHWQAKSATGGFSACKGAYVAMPQDLGGENGNLLAHESGHYFCNPHTFSSDPSTINEAATTIKNKIASKKLDPNDDTAIKNIFDGDFDNGILDTSADPGAELFGSIYGNACDPDLSKKIEVPVTLASGVKTYAFQPDRTNIMSYFKGCFLTLASFTPGQVARHYQTLQTTKKSLVDEKVKLATSEVKSRYVSIPEVVEEVEREEEYEREIELLKALSKYEMVIVKMQCGNAVLNSGEKCDDGNIISRDGCSAACQVESGFTCTKPVQKDRTKVPSKCTKVTKR